MGCGSTRVDESKEKNETLSQDILAVSKSICKIETSKKLCSGFLIKFFKDDKDFFCLMSTEENITEKMIEQKEKINFYYDNESKMKTICLNSEERYIKVFKDMGIDATVIEILPEDNIEKNYFLIPMIIHGNEYKDLKNEKIVIINYQKGKLNYSNGIIQSINNNEITHSVNSLMDSSGSILLQDNAKILGIQTKSNQAYFIWPIFNFLKNIKQNKINKEKKPEENIKNQEQEKNQIVYENGNYYIGETKNGIRHGKGIQYYENGDIMYEGNFVNDEPEGEGKSHNENGSYYIGHFKNGMKNGKGIYYYPNGDIMYEGDYIDDEPEGNGKLVMENGNYYIGQFKKGKRHGKGKSYDKDGNLFYEGDFINELPNGKGIMYFDGNKYEGDLVDGKFEGNGKFYYYEEDREYIGQFKNGNMNGKGTLYDKNGKVIYEGDFVDGKFEGNGKLFNDDGSYYIGQFRNDLKHGKGIEYDKDGNELGDMIYKEGEQMWKIKGGMEEGDFVEEEEN